MGSSRGESLALYWWFVGGLTHVLVQRGTVFMDLLQIHARGTTAEARHNCLEVRHDVGILTGQIVGKLRMFALKKMMKAAFIRREMGLLVRPDRQIVVATKRRGDSRLHRGRLRVAVELR